jgi:hypothetical protein
MTSPARDERRWTLLAAAEHAAEFWEDRYNTQHRTLHSAEDVIAELRGNLAALREAAQGDGPPTASLWLSEDRALALEAALKGVMRNQARLLEAWAQGERYDEDSDVVAELVASRDAGKVALGYPQPRFSQRPGDGRS